MARTPQPRGTHAVVIGGSIAGLVASRVLADYYRTVTLVERDHYPAEPTLRAGTPQSRHVHVLLLRGQHVLNDLFPGFLDRLAQQGAIPLDMQRDFHVHTLGGWRVVFPSQMQGYTASRSLIEWQIRQELKRFPQIQVLERHEAVGLQAGDGRITGARVRPRDGTPPAAATTTTLEADLVVDASGRHSPLPTWLTEQGYTAPETTVVDAHYGYASRAVRLPAGQKRDWKGMAIVVQPPQCLRGGVIWPIEGERWMVTLGGGGGDYPPTSDAAFLDYTKGLMDARIYDTLRDAEPLSPVVGYRDMQNIARHYENLSDLPAGIIALGDAACAMNPTYGQGMSLAALAGVTLRTTLDRFPAANAAFGRAFAAALTKTNQLPWQLATAADGRIPGTTGVQPASPTFNHYLDRVFRAGAWSPPAAQAFNEVTNLVAPVTALFRPAVVLAAARSGPPRGAKER